MFVVHFSGCMSFHFRRHTCAYCQSTEQLTANLRAMRVVATGRVADSDISRFESVYLQIPKSSDAASKLKWSNHDSNVSWTANRLQPQMHLLPWETGLAGEVFGTKKRKVLQTISDRPMQIGKHDFLLGVASSSQQVVHKPLLPKLPGHVRKLKLMQWPKDGDDLRLRAVGMIRIMIESDLSATQLGLTIHEMAHDLSDEDSIRQVLQDVFSKKSPATIYKRARSFWKYFEWMKGSYSQSLHLSEQRVYDYLCHLRDSNAAPSTGQAFIESVNFLSHLVGFVAFDASRIVSPRVKGVVHSMLIKKKPLNQARPLTKQEVAALENMVLFPESEVLAVMAGFFLFCIMNCCRFTDAQYAENMELDDSGSLYILHSGTRQHKTATTADKKTTLLPLVCLGHVFQSRSWAADWLLLIDAQGWPEDQEFLLPAFCEATGRWSTRRMSSGEGALWLRECLAAQDIDVLDTPKLPTSHSCKTTILSWMAKSGNFSVPDRQVMGHHLDRPSTSALTYGRQNFIPILVRIAALIKRIKDGNFIPDAKSSKMVTMAIEQMEQESNVHRYHAEGPLDVASDDSASDVDDNEDLEIAISQVVPGDERRCVSVRHHEKFEQHRLSGTVHLIADAMKFACGRVRSMNYLPAEHESTLGVQICEQCKSSHMGVALGVF